MNKRLISTNDIMGTQHMMNVDLTLMKKAYEQLTEGYCSSTGEYLTFLKLLVLPTVSLNVLVTDDLTNYYQTRLKLFKELIESLHRTPDNDRILNTSVGRHYSKSLNLSGLCWNTEKNSLDVKKYYDFTIDISHFNSLYALLCNILFVQMKINTVIADTYLSLKEADRYYENHSIKCFIYRWTKSKPHQQIIMQLFDTIKEIGDIIGWLTPIIIDRLKEMENDLYK